MHRSTFEESAQHGVFPYHALCYKRKEGLLTLWVSMISMHDDFHFQRSFKTKISREMSIFSKELESPNLAQQLKAHRNDGLILSGHSTNRRSTRKGSTHTPRAASSDSGQAQASITRTRRSLESIQKSSGRCGC